MARDSRYGSVAGTLMTVSPPNTGRPPSGTVLYGISICDSVDGAATDARFSSSSASTACDRQAARHHHPCKRGYSTTSDYRDIQTAPTRTRIPTALPATTNHPHGKSRTCDVRLKNFINRSDSACFAAVNPAVLLAPGDKYETGTPVG